MAAAAGTAGAGSSGMPVAGEEETCGLGLGGPGSLAGKNRYWTP